MSVNVVEELWGGTVPARTCQTGENLLRENCESYRGEVSARNVPSKSSRISIRDYLGSLSLNSSSLQNPHKGKTDENLVIKKPNGIAKLKKFWEKTGQGDLMNDGEPICVGPMGGKKYCAGSVTNQPEACKQRKLSSDVITSSFLKNWTK